MTAPTSVHVLTREGEGVIGVYRTYAAALRALSRRNGLMRIDEYEVKE